MSTSPVTPRRSTTDYDPNNPQPYQAPQLPEVQPPAVSPTAQEPIPQQHGAITKLGGFAQIGDALFRGYMKGRAQKQVNDAIRFKRQDDSYQAAYNIAAQNLKTLHDQGVDPNSDQYKQAQAAVNGSWNSLMQFRAQHVQGLDDKNSNKKKKNKQNQDAQQNPLQGLMSNDPNEKMTSAYQLMMKMGPPVYYQLGDQKRMAQQREAQDLGTQNAISGEKQQQRIYELQSKPTLTPDEQAELTRLTTKPVSPQPGDEKLKAQDALYKHIEEDPHYQLTDNDRVVLGLGPKTQVHVTGKGEVIATTEDSAGNGTYKVLRGPQSEYEPKWMHGGGGAKPPISKAKQDQIETQKNAAMQSAHSKFKANTLSFDDYVQAMQDAQDKYEDRIETLTGQPVTHLLVRDHIDPTTGDWTGEFDKYGAHSGGSTAPATHVFDAAAWKKANPKGDVNAAISQAKQQGYEVVNAGQ